MTTHAGNRPYRKHPRGSRALLTREQLFQLHVFHIECGMSAREIASQIWEKQGYASLDSCYTNLRRAWRSYRLPIRQGRGYCTGCSNPVDERTEGCDVCQNRHAFRAKHAPHLPHVLPQRRRCKGCGCDCSLFTRGCRNCVARKSNRKYRHRLLLEALEQAA